MEVPSDIPLEFMEEAVKQQGEVVCVKEPMLSWRDDTGSCHSAVLTHTDDVCLCGDTLCFLLFTDSFKAE